VVHEKRQRVGIHHFPAARMLLMKAGCRSISNVSAFQRMTRETVSGTE
jgi:hypothetical protein